MSFKTPKGRVIGLGAAKDGTEHWWMQRVTAVALIPLAILFVATFVRVAGADLDTVRAVYADPFNAIVAILFIAVAFQHLKLGLQVVIEDYVHDKTWLTVAVVANTLLCWLFGLTGVFAVARIAFSA